MTPSPLRSVEEHRARILAAVTPVDAVTVALTDAHGATLREPVRALVDLPRFDNSAMDGFAVRFDDVSGASPAAPVVLRVVADLPAGTAENPSLSPGEAARIMTGAPVPDDADVIVPFEDTAGGLADSLDTVQVQVAPSGRGAFIRRLGVDVRSGDEVLPAGTVLGPLQLAAAAAANVTEVVVSRRPRVAVLSTGSELVAPGGTLGHGRIPESNSALLVAAVADAGGETVLRRTVADEGAELEAALTEAAERGADVVVMSGGVSAGAYEVVKGTLTDMEFTGVAMQPGKPQGFGPGHPLLFGLPGNPVSVAVSFEVFVRPALLALQGRTVLDRRMLRLAAAVGWKTPPGRRQYLPVVIEGDRMRPATSGGSHLAAGAGRAEAFAIVRADVEAVAAGDVVDVMLVG